MLTSKQWFQIVSGVISGLITGAAFMQTLFGQSVTLQIIAGLGLSNIILSSVGAALSGQGADVKSVLDMPGVEKLTVNSQANQTLAKLAVDPTIDKIAPTPAALDTVTKTAEGATK